MGPYGPDNPKDSSEQSKAQKLSLDNDASVRSDPVAVLKQARLLLRLHPKC